MESQELPVYTNDDQKTRQSHLLCDKTEHRNRCRPFDVRSASDDSQLKDWCCFHFESTIKKSLGGQNQIIWHQCCMSFSRRSFLGKRDHS